MNKSIIGVIILLPLIFSPKKINGSNPIVCNAPLFTQADSITTNSIRLNWTDFNTQVEGWEIEWGLTGFMPQRVPTTDTITSLNYKLEGLEAGRAYDVYIRAICGEEGNSSWNGPFLARTAINNNLSCDLDLKIKDNNCPRQEEFTVDVSGYNGMDLGADIFIQSVDIIIEHNWPPDLQLNLVSPDGHKILLSQNRGIGLDNYGLPSSEECSEVCSFSDLACTPISDVGTEQLIGSFLPEQNISQLYQGSNVNGNWKLSICDRALEDRGILRYIKINFSPVICNVPTKITARNISDNSATIEWNPPDNCSVAIINVVESGQAPGTNIEIFTSCQLGSFNVEGLLSETAYDIYIQSDCNSSKSAFSCPATFVTACQAVTLSDGYDNAELCEQSCGASCNLTGLWNNPEDNNTQQHWLVNSGPSGTDNTGPEGDISGVGKYIYIENSIDLCGSRNQAILQTECILISDNGGICDMSFYYSMYGEDVDSLSLLISVDNGENWDFLFSEFGNKGEGWRREFIDLVDYDGMFATMRFIGISGANDRADMALDQIEFYGSERVTSLPLFYFDNDNDGYGGQDSIIAVCLNNPPLGYTIEALDCDDSNTLINPDAIEIQCNLVDENCNGMGDDAGEINPIRYSIIEVIDESCPGASDAAISLNISGGNEPYNIVWNNGLTGSSITGLEESVYFATITDAGTCTIVTEFFDIDIVNSPQIFFISSNPSQCNEATGNIDIEVAGGKEPYSYSWNNGSSNQDLNNIIEGIYSVTVTDNEGCLASLNDIQIISSPRFTAGIQFQRNLKCFGDSNGVISLGIFDAVEPIIYKWSHGDTTSIVENLAAGNYSVTIDDDRGCEEVLFAEITQPLKLNATITGIEQITCYNGSNGIIQVNTIDGAAPYNFNWNSDANISLSQLKQEDLSNLPTGSYQLSVSDGNGCLDTTQVITLTNPNEIEIEIDSIQAVKCRLSENGYLSVAVLGGAGDFSYFWGNNPSTTPFLDNIKGGVYSLTVIDKFSCKKTKSNLEVGLIDIPLSLSTDLLEDNVCSYDSLGQISVTASNAKTPIDYNWSSGRQLVKDDTSDIVFDLPNGIYNITVTDAEGCIGVSENLILNSNTEITLDNINTQFTDCNSDSTGIISLDVAGGMPPYQFLWNNGKSSPTISNLKNGDYSVTISDQANCQYEFGPLIMSSINLISVDADISNASGSGNNGSITLSISGGFPPYNVSWSNLEGNELTQTNLPAGDYCAEISDDSGCTFTSCFTIDFSDATQDIDILPIEIFPNPTASDINIVSSLIIEDINLYDSYGNRIMEHIKQGSTISLKSLSQGLYLLTFLVDNKIYTKKIVKVN